MAWRTSCTSTSSPRIRTTPSSAGCHPVCRWCLTGRRVSRTDKRSRCASMWLTRLFVQRPALVFVMIAFFIVAGVIAFLNIPQQQFPNIDLPTVSIQVNYTGASPTEMRDNIVRPIEDAIAGAPDLNVLNSTVLQGRASISAVFNLSANATTSLVEVQRRVQSAASQLPTDLRAPTISSFDPGQTEVVSLSASSRAYNRAALSDIVTNQIVPALEQVDGVGFVTANGTVTPALVVTVDPTALQSGGYTINDVVSSISGNNSRLPGGIIYQPHRETLVDVRGDDVRHDQRAAGAKSLEHQPQRPACCRRRDGHRLLRTAARVRVCRRRAAHGAQHSKDYTSQRGLDLQQRAGRAAQAASETSRRDARRRQRASEI